MQIQDASGSGYGAKVDNQHRVWTDAVIRKCITEASMERGEAYIWTATADWGADKNALWIRNDSQNRMLHIERVVACPAAAAVIEIWVGTGNTVGGTAVVGACLNRANLNTPDVTARHTNTNVDAGSGMTLLATYHCPATTVHDIPLDGALMLGYYDEIAINIVTDVGSTTFNIHGWCSVAK